MCFFISGPQNTIWADGGAGEPPGRHSPRLSLPTPSGPLLSAAGVPGASDRAGRRKLRQPRMVPGQLAGFRGVDTGTAGGLSVAKLFAGPATGRAAWVLGPRPG